MKNKIVERARFIRPRIVLSWDNAFAYGLHQVGYRIQISRVSLIIHTGVHCIVEGLDGQSLGSLPISIPCQHSSWAEVDATVAKRARYPVPEVIEYDPKEIYTQLGIVRYDQSGHRRDLFTMPVVSLCARVYGPKEDFDTVNVRLIQGSLMLRKYLSIPYITQRNMKDRMLFLPKGEFKQFCQSSLTRIEMYG